MADHPIVPSAGVPEPPGSNTGTRQHITWLGYAIPISIVLIASLAIFVGYRAERHAGFAGEADQGAISASLNYERVYADSLLLAQGAQTSYEQWLGLEQTGSTTSDPWCGSSSGAPSDPATTQLRLSCEVARSLQSADLPGYAGVYGTFNVTQYVDDVQAADGFSVDTTAGTYLDDASTQRDAERKMLAVGITLSLALALCTIAQQAYRRQWRAAHRYLPLYLAIPGWLTAVACLVLVATWKA